MTLLKMASRINGKQNPNYFKKYYSNNKERIQLRNKELYEKRRSTPDGLEKSREKSTKHTRAWRMRNPEKVRNARKQQYRKRKIRAMEMVGGAVCVRCNCDELDFLEFNHKNGGGCKEHRDNKGKGMMHMILVEGRKTDDLEILCRVCNAIDFLERKNNKQAKRFKINWIN